jgi:hypothetical protein
MGVDIYAEWNGMSDADKRAQVTGFSVEHGHVGYLREAYAGAFPVTLLKKWIEKIGFECLGGDFPARYSCGREGFHRAHHCSYRSFSVCRGGRSSIGGRP